MYGEFYISNAENDCRWVIGKNNKYSSSIRKWLANGICMELTVSTTYSIVNVTEPSQSARVFVISQKMHLWADMEVVLQHAQNQSKWIQVSHISNKIVTFAYLRQLVLIRRNIKHQAKNMY